jgi:hypothetical protein
MSDSDKPFILYKSRWSVKIVPRGAPGWLATAAWLVPQFAMTGLFAWLLAQGGSRGTTTALTVGYVLLTLALSWALYQWAKARSEVIDMDELLALKRQRDAAGRNKRT